MKTTNKQAAEFSSDEITAGVDYDGSPSFAVLGGDAKFHYFLAAKDNSNGRPDSVERVELMGYEKCVTEKCVSGSDCVLMRIPMERFTARRKAKQANRRAAGKAAERPRGIPDSALYELSEAGDRPGAFEEDE